MPVLKLLQQLRSAAEGFFMLILRLGLGLLSFGISQNVEI